MSNLLAISGLGGPGNTTNPPKNDATSPGQDKKADDPAPVSGTGANESEAPQDVAAPAETAPAQPVTQGERASASVEIVRAQPQSVVEARLEGESVSTQDELARAREIAQAFQQTARNEAVVDALRAPQPSTLLQTPAEPAAATAEIIDPGASASPPAA